MQDDFAAEAGRGDAPEDQKRSHGAGFQRDDRLEHAIKAKVPGQPGQNVIKRGNERKREQDDRRYRYEEADRSAPEA
jgi:hypothetical protein